MNDNTEKLKEIISTYIDLSPSEWSVLLPAVEVRTYDKGDILLFEGDRSSCIYIVLSGLLRTYFTRGDGEEKTFFFSSEGELAADYENMLKEQPSYYSIDALEQTTVVIITTLGMNRLFETLPSADKLFRVIIEKYFFIWSQRITDYQMHTPRERYNKLCERYPDIIQRVPQYYIASYLNVSTVHLSRLKRRI